MKHATKILQIIFIIGYSAMWGSIWYFIAVSRIDPVYFLATLSTVCVLQLIYNHNYPRV